MKPYTDCRPGRVSAVATSRDTWRERAKNAERELAELKAAVRLLNLYPKQPDSALRTLERIMP